MARVRFRLTSDCFGGDTTTRVALAKAESGGTQVYAVVEKAGHHRNVEDLERKDDLKEPEADTSTTHRMKRRMKTQKGREKYKLRQQTVEPVFGIINLAGRCQESPGTKD